MKKLMLDPGHGGTDPGAVNTAKKTTEAERNLKIALMVGDIISKYYDGVEIQYTRKTDVFVDLNKRAQLSNQWGADYFVSFHLNASIHKDANGFETYIHTSSGTQTVENQAKLHETIFSFINRYGIKDRGKQKANFAVLRETECSACLLENLFISNDRECDLINNGEFLYDLSQGIALGIAKVLELPKKKSVEPQKALYRVSQDGKQIGAFGQTSNVLNTVSKSLEAGSGTILIEKVTE
jgi:N-acetylmuramoyl-L-alanine amidase